ncbi:molybdate ABC transporter substrate-binding protein [Nitrospirillum sp. BR 11163]|uniref:molybdate ABC transporter substrate-binding protein n=1 Tax=Nitrospirillum sp. BR 11163 TaxID=3104323 RepID=UPI002AFFE59F|nr:molybdate ABC transporter substrate-binding protein [Nitrospirillum sp. BR 11163]MEA1674210.1 molybdate ABC transporter substrate-binding protein [Nitrospirillum sp. BR 11163]
MHETLNWRMLGRMAASMAVMVMMGLGTAPARAQGGGPLVFAAASLKNALDNANAAYVAGGGAKATITYAASSALAKQIEAGAPADVFISADEDWMDYLAGKGLIQPTTRRDLLGNDLVLVATADSKTTLEIKQGFALDQALDAAQKGGRLAVGDPTAVPAGKYAKAALQKLGAWDKVQDRLAPAENVRAALALVARGEAPFGIVYKTDAVAEPGVRIVATFPVDSHAPILYPIALAKDSTSAQARVFLEFVASPQARPLFEAQGFTVLSAK